MKKIFSLLGFKSKKEFLYINLGVFVMSASYSILLDANNMIAGGVGGLATILKNISFFGYHISSSIFILILNLILLLIAFIFIGKEFFFKTFYASLIYPIYTLFCTFIYNKLLINILPNLGEISSLIDNAIPGTGKVATAGAYLLIVVFGAVSSGYGLGIALKNGASTGGVDILQKLLLDKLKIPFSISMILIDGSIILAASIFFQDVFIVMCGILFVAISGFMLDSIVFSGFSSRAVNIVTTRPEEIKDLIFNSIGRGATIIKSRGAYTGNEKATIVCLMTNSEFYRIKDKINSIDAKAFIHVTRASEVHGEGFSYDPEKTELND